MNLLLKPMALVGLLAAFVLGGGVGIALLVVAGLAFVWLGPVQVGNKKAMLDFLLGRGIEGHDLAGPVDQRFIVEPGHCLPIDGIALGAGKAPRLALEPGRLDRRAGCARAPAAHAGSRTLIYNVFN